MSFLNKRKSRSNSNSLKEELKKAIERNAAGETDIDGYTEEISNAFKNFLTRQEFRVVKLESEVEIEHLRTTDGLSVDISPDTLYGPYAPLINMLKKLASFVPGASSIFGPLESKLKSIIRKVSDGGATLPNLNLQADSHGLEVKGVSTVDTVHKGKKTSEGLAKKSTVVLFSDEIND